VPRQLGIHLGPLKECLLRAAPVLHHDDLPFEAACAAAAATAAAAAASAAAAAAAAAALRSTARLRLCHRLRLWCPRLWRRRLGRSLSIVGLSWLRTTDWFFCWLGWLSEVRQIRSRRARGLR
jgi:hypothetical protein